MSVHVDELVSNVELEPSADTTRSGPAAAAPGSSPGGVELEHREAQRRLARDRARTFSEGYAD
jgi:hypothetical protein